MSPRLIDAGHCPHCKAEVEDRELRICPECGGSLQKRFLKAGCLSTAPPAILLLALLAAVSGAQDGPDPSSAEVARRSQPIVPEGSAPFAAPGRCNAGPLSIDRGVLPPTGSEPEMKRHLGE